MTYFYRYLMTENQINNDIARGYGFRFYDLHETVSDLVKNSPFIEMEPGFFDLDLDGLSDSEILEALEDAGIVVRRDNATGMFGLSYDGLSAFGPFETSADARAAALEWHYQGFDGQRFDFVAIVSGDITGSVDDNDLDTIKVESVIEVISK